MGEAEVWKQIDSLFYEVSNNGDIRNSRRKRLLKLQTTWRGYKRICLFIKGIKRYFYVHRLVMDSFSPSNNTSLQVNHKNGIKTDNRLSNLEWVTQSENNKHAFKIGLRSHKGESHNKAFLTNEKAVQIFKATGTQEKIAINFGISRTMVSAIKTGRSWGHVTEMLKPI